MRCFFGRKSIKYCLYSTFLEDEWNEECFGEFGAYLQVL